jgi:DNA repair exonuclease SbcCD ATPase subunit
MKILRLAAENVKRLSVVEITPQGTVITVGGKNGAGKSSVLDAIAYALGGEKLVPSHPIRDGAAEAKVTVDLGTLIVTRRFYHEKFPCNCEVQQAGEHKPDCHSKLVGETKSKLVVSNREGAQYPSPQKMLDDLLGRLTFDPLAFMKEKPQRQNELLRQLTSLDFSMLDKTRKEAFDRRAMTKKTLAIADTRLIDLPHHADAPATIISIDEISAEIRKGQELQRIAETRIAAVDTMQRTLDTIRQERTRSAAALDELRKRIQEEEKRLKNIDENIEAHKKEAEKLVVVAEEAKKAVPNFEQLEGRLRQIDATNGKVRANITHEEQKKEIKQLTALIAADDVIINDIDAKKAAMLEAAQFPVAGLGLSDDGVTYENLPLEEVSTSVQLRTSVAIGLALNPKLKVLLIRNGNLLDEDSLKAVATQAEEAGAQVWMEFVTSNGDGMSVMLEDGHVK